MDSYNQSIDPDPNDYVDIGTAYPEIADFSAVDAANFDLNAQQAAEFDLSDVSAALANVEGIAGPSNFHTNYDPTLLSFDEANEAGPSDQAAVPSGSATTFACGGCGKHFSKQHLAT